MSAPAASASAHITATATAGSSGADIFCSVDGGPAVEYSGASAQVPVSGLGPHGASCYAQNHAVDATGALARSATQTIGLSIRQPTAQAVTFARIADALRCRTVTVGVKVRGRDRIVRRHGKTIQVPGRTRVVKRRVRRCAARVVRRRVTRIVIRHGKPVKVHKIVRVVLPPHAVFKATRRIGFGRATTVSGYLGLTSGAPLGGRTVQVIAAPNNGLGQFTLPIATVVTSSSGTWTANVPPGPSRLIEAVYGGTGTEEPTVSAAVTLTVSARIRLLSVTPRVVPWGATVQIVGKLYGGYLPAAGALVRLRQGYGRRARTTFGVIQHVTGSGLFSTSFTFGPGPAGLPVRYWFSASLLAHADYPFAAASSLRRYVLVGGHPPHHHRVLGVRHHHHKKRHHHRRLRSHHHRHHKRHHRKAIHHKRHHHKIRRPRR